MNHAARIVVIVVAVVVLAYTGVDVVNCIKAGKMDDASRQGFNGALFALIALIATTGKGSPPEQPAGTPKDPLSTKEVEN